MCSVDSIGPENISSFLSNIGCTLALIWGVLLALTLSQLSQFR